MSYAAAIGAGAAAAGSIVSAAIGSAGNAHHNTKMRQLARKSFEFQKQQYQDQLKLIDKEMAREDNAYQRKVADLTAAGLNPILAAGGSGEASGPYHVAPAPQADLAGEASSAAASLQMAALYKDVFQKTAEIYKTQAETEYIKSQKEHQDIINAHEDDYLSGRNKLQELDLAYLDKTIDARVESTLVDLDSQKKKNVLLDLEAILKNQDIDYNVSRKELADLEISLRNKDITFREKQILLIGAQIVKQNQENDAFEDKVKFWKSLGLPYDTKIDKDSVLFGVFNAVTGGGNYTPGERLQKLIDLLSGKYNDLIGGSPDPENPQFHYSRKEWKQAVKEATSYPESDNFLWNNRMIKESDYGVRRNH